MHKLRYGGVYILKIVPIFIFQTVITTSNIIFHFFLYQFNSHSSKRLKFENANVKSGWQN